jgi:hypothetical protein
LELAKLSAVPLLNLLVPNDSTGIERLWKLHRSSFVKQHAIFLDVLGKFKNENPSADFAVKARLEASIKALKGLLILAREAKVFDEKVLTRWPELTEKGPLGRHWKLLHLPTIEAAKIDFAYLYFATTAHQKLSSQSAPMFLLISDAQKIVQQQAADERKRQELKNQNLGKANSGL